jgi:dihydroxyacid dehydratase/phosphogluconate dehydratase
VKPRGKKPTVEERRAERALFFWSAREGLRVILFGALTICAVVVLIKDGPRGGAALAELLTKLAALI